MTTHIITKNTLAASYTGHHGRRIRTGRFKMRAFSVRIKNHFIFPILVSCGIQKLAPDLPDDQNPIKSTCERKPKVQNSINSSKTGHASALPITVQVHDCPQPSELRPQFTRVILGLWVCLLTSTIATGPAYAQQPAPKAAQEVVKELAGEIANAEKALEVLNEAVEAGSKVDVEVLSRARWVVDKLKGIRQGIINAFPGIASASSRVGRLAFKAVKFGGGGPVSVALYVLDPTQLAGGTGSKRWKFTGEIDIRGPIVEGGGDNIYVHYLACGLYFLEGLTTVYEDSSRPRHISYAGAATADKSKRASMFVCKKLSSPNHPLVKQLFEEYIYSDTMDN